MDPAHGMVAWALRGRILTPTERGALRFFEDGVLGVDDQGRIVTVGNRKRPLPVPLYDVHPHLVIPGFVDAHVHFPQTRIIGRATGPLLDWLKKSVFPEESRFARAGYARAVADEFIDRMLAVGTTTAAIFSSSSKSATHILFQRLAERGMRAVVGLTLMDRGAPKALLVGRKQALRDADALIRRWHDHDGGRLRFAVTPRFALSCSRALLCDAGRLAATHALAVQTHISENESECAATRAAHAYARDYLDVYERAGLVGRQTILAHAVHLSAREWRRLHGAGAGVAHCPDSNFFLGSGRMPLARARAGKLALGSDVAAGRSFSLRRAMASAYDNAMCLGETVAPAELFTLATLGGARALGCEARTGSLEPGKDADFVVLRAGNGAQSAAELLAALVFEGDDLAVEACYVRGKRLERVAPGPRGN